MIPAQLLEGVLSLPDIFGKHLANVEEHWRPHLVRSLVSHELILMSIWLCGKICWLSLQRVPCGFVPRPKRFVASVPCFSASGKRPAVKQGPDLYLEPKWLRCLQHVICTRPTKVPFISLMSAHDASCTVKNVIFAQATATLTLSASF